MAKKDTNVFVFTGRLCADPELKYTASGNAVANLRVACNRGREEQGQDADFFTVEVWKGSAEFAANYLKKGDLVAVTGRLRIRPWTTQDGTKRISVEVVAHELNALGKKSDSGQADEDGPPHSGPDEADANDPFVDE